MMKSGLLVSLFKCLSLVLIFWTGTVLAATPGPTTPISPSGNTGDSTPTYSWNAVGSATFYQLWVLDSGGQPFQQWYSAENAGCSGGRGTCSVTSTEVVASGAANFWVQTWNSDGHGPWSAASSFSIGGASGVPGAARLTAPVGTTMSSSPTYSWAAVANASWYYLWVQDTGGVKNQQWYTAAQANCASGTSTCSVTPSSLLAPGSVSFWVRTWNSVGLGPWSAAGNFTVSTADPNSVMCTAPTAQVQMALLAAINTLRSTPTQCRGVTIPAKPPLIWNNALGASAQGHSSDMATNDYFSHTGQNGSRFFTRAADAGYTGFATGENIAGGQTTVGIVVNGWVGSDTGHCEYLMTDSDQMGAGCASNPASTWRHYWTFQAGNGN